MKSLYKYQKENFKKITIKKELYNKLKTLSAKEGLTIPQFLEKLIDTYIVNYIDTYIGNNNNSIKNDTTIITTSNKLMVNKTLYMYSKDKE